MKKLTFLFIVIITMAGMLAMSGCNKDKKATYWVSFDANGGTGTMSEQKFIEGEASALSANAFTREGYEFKEWNTVNDGSGKSFADGEKITVSSDMTLYAQWEEIINPNQLNGHVWVDLGLPSGLLWAESNVNSKLPQAFGRYLAWGEIEEHTDAYSFRFYRYAWEDSFTNPELDKYCNNAAIGSDGFTDNLTTLVASDDVATALWGEGWRMPTKDEMQELLTNCTKTWETQKGNPGYVFTGPNGNSIFMTAAGYCEGDDFYAQEREVGKYWTSSLYTDNATKAYCLEFTENNCSISQDYRCYGHTVRAVCRIQE